MNYLYSNKFKITINKKVMEEQDIQIKKQEILVKSGLNWKVREIGLRSDDEFGLKVPETKSIWRVEGDDEDGSPNDIYLGIHKDGYEVFQNNELLDILFKISQKSGLELHKGGLFGDGQKVWLQLKSDSHSMPGNDRIDGYITGINSFDGGTSLGFGNSTMTISCRNTFWAAYHELDTKIRHTGKLRDRLDEVLRKIDILLEEEKKHFEMVDHLADVRITPEVKDLVTRMLFDLTKHDRLDEEVVKEMSTRKKNSYDQFNLDLQTELSGKGDNLWGLFSGVTRYTTHSMKKNDNTGNMKAKMIGAAGRKERKIWTTLVDSVY